MTSWRELGGGTRTRGFLVTAVQRFSGAVSPPCDAGAGSPAPGAPAQHRRRVRTISWEPPSRVATPKLRVGTRNQADPAGCDSRQLRPPPRCARRRPDHGEHLEFSKEITALLAIYPYNEFISAGPPSIDTGRPGSGPRKAGVVINSRIVSQPEVMARTGSAWITTEWPGGLAAARPSQNWA